MAGISSTMLVVGILAMALAAAIGLSGIHKLFREGRETSSVRTRTQMIEEMDRHEDA